VDVPHSRLRVRLQLPPSDAQEVLDSRKVLLPDRQVLAELGAHVGAEVGLRFLFPLRRRRRQPSGNAREREPWSLTGGLARIIRRHDR